MLNYVRRGLGNIIILIDKLTAPKSMERSPVKQAQVNLQCHDLVLYELNACPFCVKVRRHMRRLNLNIERRDIGTSDEALKELLEGGKADQVPCLRITEKGNARWLYESSDIIAYLNERFAPTLEQ